jgi:hypothetical protein
MSTIVILSIIVGFIGVLAYTIKEFLNIEVTK